MSVLKIELLGSDVLRRRAEEIDAVDDDLRSLVRDMFDTMYEAEGIGLAGPQVGIDRRVIVVDIREEGSTPFALVNPRIVESSRDTEKADEGCLSIPGISGVVERPARVVVEGLSERGEPVRMEADGLLGRCLQHEVDHLDGVLFIDRLSPLKRKMALKRYRTLAEEEEKKREPRSTAPARSRG
jgi:peptide deformylase